MPPLPHASADPCEPGPASSLVHRSSSDDPAERTIARPEVPCKQTPGAAPDREGVVGMLADGAKDRAAHTPGTWVVEMTDAATDGLHWPSGTVGPTIFAGSELIADLARVGGLTEADVADAHLIASAPDLLAACEAWQYAYRGVRNEKEAEAARIHADALTRAALAKAKGGAS